MENVWLYDTSKIVLTSVIGRREDCRSIHSKEMVSLQPLNETAYKNVNRLIAQQPTSLSTPRTMHPCKLISSMSIQKEEPSLDSAQAMRSVVPYEQKVKQMIL